MGNIESGGLYTEESRLLKVLLQTTILYVLGWSLNRDAPWNIVVVGETFVVLHSHTQRSTDRNMTSLDSV